MSIPEGLGNKYIYQGCDSMSEIEIDGLDKLLARLNKIDDNLQNKMLKAAEFVEGEAREKAPFRQEVNGKPGSTGRLKGSIESKVEREGNMITGIVFTPVEYAPYQEFGTGLFAVNGDGRKTPWVYEDEQTGKFVYTRGNRPHPFLAPALRENEDVVMQILKGGLNDV